MPQPLSSFPKTGAVMLAAINDRPLSRHPELAVLAMEAIASWSMVESFMLNLFIELMGGPKALAAEMYLAFDIQSAKTKAILVAANSKFKDEPQKLALLTALLGLGKTNQKHRDKLAHHVWGYWSAMPDALLLVDPKDCLMGSDFDDSKVFVYRAPDFKGIIEANHRLAAFGFDFIVVLRDQDRAPQVFDQLCKEPEIQERLNRQA